MKKLLQKWLGIDVINQRIYTLELTNKIPPVPTKDLPYPSDGECLQRGVWEHIYAIIHHLKVIPSEIWEDDPSVIPPEHPKRRKLVLKDEPMFAYRFAKKKKKKSPTN